MAEPTTLAIGLRFQNTQEGLKLKNMVYVHKTITLILEYLGGIETAHQTLPIRQNIPLILEYLGGIETYDRFLVMRPSTVILEYLGGIET